MSAGRFTARSPFLRGRPSGIEADLINRLRKLPVGAAPDTRFKADLRSQLVAITARVVAESSTAVEAGSVAAAAPARRRGAMRGIFSHPAAALGAVAAVIALVLFSATAMSGKALPGDTLYKLKRTSENIALSLASGDSAKGREYLKQATERADEAQALLARGNTARNQNLASKALAEADSDSRSGMQALGRSAVSNVSVTPLDTVDAWVAKQRSSVKAVKTAGAGGESARSAASSLALLDRIAARSHGLRAKLACPCMSVANSDDLGPIPCNQPCKSLITNKPSLPGTLPNVPVPGSLTPGTSVPGSTGNLSSLPGTSAAAPLSSTMSGAAPSATSSGIHIPLPTQLPLPTSGLPSLPEVGITALPGLSLGANGGGVSVYENNTGGLDLLQLLNLK